MGLSSDQKKALDELLISAFERKVKNFNVSKSMDNSFVQSNVIPENIGEYFLLYIPGVLELVWDFMNRLLKH